MPQHVHGILSTSLPVPLDALCELWRAFPLNWRRIKSIQTPHFACDQKKQPGMDDKCIAFTLQCHLFSGLFLLNSLLEHSCKPNLAAHWENNSLCFVAVRDIPAGSRATMSYLDLSEMALPGDDRRKILSDTWHFACCCEYCQQEQSQVRSNAQVHAIPELSVLHRW